MGIEHSIIHVVLALLPGVALFAERDAQAASESIEVFAVGDRRYKVFRIGVWISMAFVGGAPTLTLASTRVQGCLHG